MAKIITREDLPAGADDKALALARLAVAKRAEAHLTACVQTSIMDGMEWVLQHMALRNEATNIRANMWRKRAEEAEAKLAALYTE